MADKVPRTPMEAMSVTMISYGTSLDTESVYGKSLIRAGAAHDKLALEQLNFVSRHSLKLEGLDF